MRLPRIAIKRTKAGRVLLDVNNEGVLVDVVDENFGHVITPLIGEAVTVIVDMVI